MFDIDEFGLFHYYCSMKNRKIRKWIQQNVKKVLALVLAFACAFTMFAGAAFTDSADVSQTEAVDMLTALGVIDGYEDGSFRPDATVTRAEMAKMIYVIRNGGSDVVTQYEGYKTPFTDVENVNHWAKGYIAYCYANGIIAGKSATSFDPDATVTGQEAAKMALVLLGYDPAKAGLEGSAWGTNTINLATQKDLFADYTISITSGCDRQFAAQLLYNTLWACTVRWSNDSGSYQDVVETVTSNDGVTAKLLNVTVAKKYMGLEEATGIYLGDNKINTGLKDGQSSVTFIGADASYGTKTITFVPENGNNLVGEAVKVLYKENKNGTTGPDDKDTVYGVTLTTDTSVVKATLGDIGDDDTAFSSGVRVKDKIKVDGTKYDVYSTGMDVYVNFVQIASGVHADNFTDSLVYDGVAGFKKDSADTVKFILNDNGKVIAAYIENPIFVKVTGLTSEKISLAGIGTLDIDDSMELDSNVAKNDIVALTTLYNGDPTDDDAYNIITKAEVATGIKVTDMKDNAAHTKQEVMIDGAYAKCAYDRNFGTMDGDYINALQLDATYDFVMYNGYWVAAKEVEAASKDIALLVAQDPSGVVGGRVKVMLPDGTQKIYEYDDDDGANTSLGSLALDTIYSYTLVGDSKIQLKNTALVGLDHYDEAVGAADNTYNEDNKTLSVASGSFVTANEAVAFVKLSPSGKYYAYNADSIKSIDKDDVSGTVQYFLNNDNEVVAFYLTSAKKPGASASNAQYGYVVDDVKSSSVDGTEYRELSVWNGTEVVTLKVETSAAIVINGDTVMKGSFIQYSVGADGMTDKADIKMLTVGNVAAVESYSESRNLLTLYKNAANTGAGVNAYKLASDCVVIGVNTKDNASAEGYDAITEALVSGTVATKNVVYVLNGDNEIVAIFVDSKNEIDNIDIAPNAGNGGAGFVAE